MKYLLLIITWSVASPAAFAGSDERVQFSNGSTLVIGGKSVSHLRFLTKYYHEMGLRIPDPYQEAKITFVELNYKDDKAGFRKHNITYGRPQENVAPTHIHILTELGPAIITQDGVMQVATKPKFSARNLDLGPEQVSVSRMNLNNTRGQLSVLMLKPYSYRKDAANTEGFFAYYLPSDEAEPSQVAFDHLMSNLRTGPGSSQYSIQVKLNEVFGMEVPLVLVQSVDDQLLARISFTTPQFPPTQDWLENALDRKGITELNRIWLSIRAKALPFEISLPDVYKTFLDRYQQGDLQAVLAQVDLTKELYQMARRNEGVISFDPCKIIVDLQRMPPLDGRGYQH